jgi:hypothetical protein
MAGHVEMYFRITNGEVTQITKAEYDALQQRDLCVWKSPEIQKLADEIPRHISKVMIKVNGDPQKIAKRVAAAFQSEEDKRFEAWCKEFEGR